MNYRHAECAAAYRTVVLLCADLWQAGGSGEQSLAAVNCGAVFSVAAQFNQRVTIQKSLSQTSVHSPDGGTVKNSEI